MLTHIAKHSQSTHGRTCQDHEIPLSRAGFVRDIKTRGIVLEPLYIAQNAHIAEMPGQDA